ncbi:Crp/Fnr family transcriptional regulator [Alginatibacterium sediminis]|uniref:Crp/Fnr family transcriptional regulator n=1 Tax=Alginatibacterium sediminis TaxID=2164068 RepID=A0A420E6G1_9ALTE|nr:Crp/Fnr family transcriptional regulator [Alginatibacterium sediminis]RKF13257.1 Crp/Fnr family transcriptional regulator [Alginatibacterium sediminis]
MSTSIQISTIQWPCELSDEFKYDLLKCAKRRTLFEQNDSNPSYNRPKGLVYILAGAACFYFLDKNSRTIFGGLISPRDWAGAAGMKGGYNHAPGIWMRPIQPLDCLFIGFDDVERLSQSHLEMYKFLYFANQEIQYKWGQVQLMLNHNKQQRVAYALIELLALQKSYIDTYPRIPISQHDLGLACGLSRPRVNQVLQEFVRAGFISLERKYIGIVDQSRLEAEIDDVELIFTDPRKRLRKLD